MPTLVYLSKTYSCHNETVLDALIRQNANVSFSCKKGSCHSCMLKEINNNTPDGSQKGLPERLQKLGYFLPCISFPTSDMEICKPLIDDINAPADAVTYPMNSEDIVNRQQTEYPKPDISVWQALDNGKLLTKILDDFYDAVYEDAVMSPYFHNATKARSKEKVYSFYKKIFTGEDVFFGDKPQNAHSWMVISNDIFDYRTNLLRSVLNKHNVDKKVIAKWLAVEETFRDDIVKSRPRGRVVNGQELPAEGYDSIVLTSGSMCDACNKEILAGTKVNYHLRTGKLFCPQCGIQ